MKFPSTLYTAALAATPFTAIAHMIMVDPKPFGNPSNSPLLENGSDFPCKGIKPDDKTPRTQWTVGSQGRLKISGTANHSGGSCQISVTTDKNPTKSSKWKVILSIEGGCPSAHAGNYADDGTSPAPPFNFTIPPELPDGDFVASWTWFNHKGNREMYQNCAPVKISGGAKDNNAFDKLPDMAIANIPSVNSCKTTPEFDYKFENPGKYVIRNGVSPLVNLCGGGGTEQGGGSTSPAPAPAPQQPGASSKAPAPSAAQPAPAQPSTLKTIITVTAPNASGTPPPPPPAAQPPSSGTPQAPASPSAAPAPSQAPASPPSAPAPSQAPAAPAPDASGTACPTDGAIVCNGADKFAVCDHGKAIWQDVAKGTTCTNGKLARREEADLPTTLVRLGRWSRGSV